MTKKKTLLISLSVILVAAIAVVGTIALLKHSTEPKNNIIVIGELFESGADNGLFIKEHSVTQRGDGSYELNASEFADSSLNYIALPGVAIPKDTYVELKGLNLHAYLFIEIVDESLEEGLTYEVDSSWVKLDGVEGPNGGDVYCYTGAIVTSKNIDNAYILKDNELKVSPTFEGIDGESKIDFYAYICQSAGFDTPLAAFNASFK